MPTRHETQMSIVPPVVDSVVTPELSKGHLARMEVFKKPERGFWGFAICEGMAVLSGALGWDSVFQGHECKVS